PDHLDIYGTEEAYLESFAHFTELIQPGGALLLHTGLKLKPRQSDSVRVYTYGVDSGDFHAENLTFADGTITFDLVTPTNGTITGIELGVPLEINVDNAIAACAGVMLANDPAITADDYRTAMKTFLGAKRRFEFWLREPERSIIDDYAHHPDELRASIRSVRRLFPGKRLVVAFQPHLFSRTRDFAADFAEALSQADSVYLLPIYPARELPIPGVTSEIILDRITCPEKQIIEKEQLVNALAAADFDVLLTVGAGDINLLLPRIVDACK
ncbi:MAG: UDP-N-acetylmuramate--L-alanine ligase, partial [Muribaculaceae bacterium]|nr:UDP-N-acetylmuramate--L-alanine ligase [Muribaculaceae bacterium]